MAIQGLRTTDNFVTDGRPKNWREGILMLKPNGTAPLFALTSMMGAARKVDDPEFNWWTKKMETRRVQLGANLTNANTTITLTGGGNGININSILKVEQTGELMRVTAINTDTSIDVERSWSTVVATAVDFDGTGVNPNLQIIGNVFEENSDAPNGTQYDPVKYNNLTQIFRHTLEMSRTAKGTRLRTGDQLKQAKAETMEIHSADIERALWFGEKVETTINGNPARTMGGITSFIPSDNIKTAGASTDMEALEGYLEDIFRYGATEKMAFMGNRALNVINQIVRKNTDYQIFVNEKEYGMKVSKLCSPFGDLVLKTHPLFNQMTGGTTSGQAYLGPESDMIVCDMGNLKYVEFAEEGATHYQKKLQDNGVDGLKSGYLTECSLELHHPDTFYWVKGLTSAAVDS